jgi:hypothetical protein
MAATYDVVAQRPGIQTLGGVQTQDVVFVGINTKPSGIYVEFPVLKSVYKPSIVAAAALGWANIAESLAAENWVTDVQWTELVTAGSQLQPGWVITVESTSGQSAAQLTVANSELGPKLDAAAITALHKQLDETEAL